ncbi:MAG: methyltransferase domain-containing protein [Methyloligellaceae bacterium]
MAENVTWDPNHYLSFDSHRLRPAIDLISQISVEAPRAIADLGCGPGNVTNIIQERWSDASVSGVDSSQEMLDQAKERNAKIDWIRADLNSWKSENSFDLLFSNAALHWLDNHRELFPKLLANVAPGGIIAIQMPRNWQAPSHSSINEVIVEGPWKELLEPEIVLEPSHSPDVYYDILSPLTEKLSIWETDYIQVLEGENPVAEFVKGSWLQRFLQLLEEPFRSEFESAYREKVLNAYQKQSDGKTLFPFKRLFIVAQKRA